jgi:DNA-binding MarR family transcriptional regulator
MRALLHEIGLYRGQPLMLRALWDEEGLTQTALAERLRRAPATITNMLQRMERAGFVERSPDPSDQRVTRVYLSEAGRNVRDRVQAVWRELEEVALQGLSAQEVATLRQCLDTIRTNLSSAHSRTE